LPVVRHHEDSKTQWTSITDYEYNPDTFAARIDRVVINPREKIRAVAKF
jgi:hypothetical protein